MGNRQSPLQERRTIYVVAGLVQYRLEAASQHDHCSTVFRAASEGCDLQAQHIKTGCFYTHIFRGAVSVRAGEAPQQAPAATSAAA